MTPREVEHASRRSASKERAPVGKSILYMTVLSVLFWWLAVEANPLFTRFGLSPATIFRIPIYAFAGGLLAGLGAARTRSGRQTMAFAGLLASSLVALWTLALVVGSITVLVGFSTNVADWAYDITLVAGVIVFGTLLIVIGFEALSDKLSARGSSRS